MSKLSRRSLVAGAATLPALTVPAVAGVSYTPIPLPAAGDDGRAASVVRAQYIVETLSTRYIREGWHKTFDRERAARFIENMQTFDEEDGTDPRFQEILAWAYDHGQSLDWLFDGDLVGMICRRASTSPVAMATPDPAFAAIERFRAARKASEAVGKEEPRDGTHTAHYKKWFDRQMAAVDVESEAHEAMVTTRATTKAGAQALVAAHIEQLDPSTEDVDRTLLETLAEAIPHLA